MRRVPTTVQAVAGLLAGRLAASAWDGTVAAALALTLGAFVSQVGRRATVFLLAASLGCVALARQGETEKVDPLAARLGSEPTRIEAEGTVLTSEPAGPLGSSFLLDAVAWRTGEGRDEGMARLRVLVTDIDSEEGAVHPGDAVRVTGLASPIAGPTNPGAFDARAFWARQGVHARLVVPDARAIERRTTGDGPLAWLSRARHAAAAGFDAAFLPADAGLLRSLLLGDRGALTPDDRERFRAAGAAHILAISGSHVALLVTGLLILLRGARCPPRPAAGLVLAAIAAFVPFTGSAAPVVRSAAGFGLFLLGRLLGREPSGGVVLAAVASTFLTVDPSAGDDPGFRMSFAAAAGLVLLAGPLRRRLVGDRVLVLPGAGPPSKAPLRSAIAAGTAAWLASTPVAIHDLGQMGWVAVPVGIVAVPLSTLAMLAGFAAVGLSSVPWAGPALVQGVEVLLGALRGFLDVPALIGLEQFAVPSPGVLWYAAYIVCFLAAARGPRALGDVALGGLFVLLGALDGTAESVPPPCVRLTLLDVGHGQAALLETSDGRRALLDAGSRDRPEPASRLICPALRALGVRSLDLAVASHQDADHAGALAEVLREFPARLVVVPPQFPPALLDSIAKESAARLVAVDGDVLLQGAWGRLVVVGPSPPPLRRPTTGRSSDPSTNDGCLVLRLETPATSVLLPGDREERGVDDLLRAHPNVEADVLVLPHHGHPGAGMTRLLDACRPRLLLASTPRTAVAGLPTGTWSTAQDGALVLDLLPTGPVVSTPWSPRPSMEPGYDPVPFPAARPMRDPLSLALAGALLCGIVLLSIRLRWLTRAGALGAGVLGFAALLAFSWAGLAALLAPFLVVTLAEKLPGGPGGEGSRTLRQVAANGLPCVTGIVLALAGHPRSGALAFTGALAALGADSLATAIGTRYGGTPRHAITGRALASGESGGVTSLGLVASWIGAVLAPAAFAAAGEVPWRGVAWIAAAGFLAGYVDSLLGALLQRKGTCAVCGQVVEGRTCHDAVPTPLPGRLGFLDNDGVNVLCGLAGAALALLLPH